jgi:sugar O-acyltransferase (sialic acid O-acetyltransferase NeuD family)
MMRLVILGAESIGREASEIAAESGYKSIDFLDDSPALQDRRMQGPSIVGGFAKTTELVGPATEFFVAVGTINVRTKWMKAVRDAGGRLATLVHPRACVSPSSALGPNTMISFGCHIGPNVVMGEGNILWSSVVISHDCTVGAHCFFGPTVASGGYTHIGDHSMFGCGAKLRSCITIGSRVVVGMGAIVAQPVPDDHYVAVGADPKPIKGKSHEDIYFGQIRTLPRRA